MSPLKSRGLTNEYKIDPLRRSLQIDSRPLGATGSYRSGLVGREDLDASEEFSGALGGKRSFKSALQAGHISP